MKEMFVSCPEGVEDLLLEELREMGIPGEAGFLGCYVPAEMAHVYKINYCSRLAIRVLWPLAQFSCPNKDVLYSESMKIDWSEFLNPQLTFAIDANVISHPNLRNSLFAALVVKDAVCDQLRDKFGERPSIDVKAPDVQLNLFIHKGQATVSFDTSGKPLYKRGYREVSVAAPLQECLAAAILKLARYKPEDTLYDPFCGAGTFLIEAAMSATKTPSGFFRKEWGFFRMPGHSKELWLTIKKNADAEKVPLQSGKISGSDKNFEAVESCHRNLKHLGFDIEITMSTAKHAKPPFKPSLVVANPPYGRRLQTSTDPTNDLLQFLASKCDSPVRMAFLSPHRYSPRFLKAPIEMELPFSNGGLDIFLYILKK